MNIEKPKKKIKASSIILYSVCVILFLFAAYGIAIKVTNNSIYLFGIRSDAVLSESMSYKNEDPIVQDFLKGYNNQIQKGDLVYSEKVTSNTELNVHDIVIFKHHDTGLDTIHRIVEIKDGDDYEDKQPRYVIRADTANHESDDGVYSRNEILAKYKTKIGFLGHIKIFFSTIYGTILIVGLIVIMLVYDYLASNHVKNNKKNNKAEKTTEESKTNE